jgi:MFS family permease
MTETITIWQVIGLSIVLGIINAFDMPTSQSFMVEMIEDKKDLGNAIALNSSMVTGARLIGPSLAGILIAAFGEGVCFLINALSYLAVIISLFLMKIINMNNKPHHSKPFKELKEGFQYAFSFKPIRAILLMFALVNLVGMPYMVLMPIFAKDVLHGGPDALGFLMGCAGMGALAGALFLASRKSVLGLGRIISLSTIIFGVGLVAFSFSRIMLLSLLLLLIVGFEQIVQMASSNTLLQTIVDDDKRGRVMSFYIMAFMGATPLGSLISGYLASNIGAPWTLCIGGIACAVGAVMFLKKLPFLREMVRPIYINKGILPEITLGIHSATGLSAPKNINDIH